VSGKSKPVFDASAALALLQNETGADRLDRVRKDAIMSAVSAAEVLVKLIGKGMPQNLAVAALDALHVEVVAFDPEEAVLSAAYVAKDVSLGDRCFLACAYKNGTGWTADHDLARIGSKMLPPLKMFR
jgi:PIN domain nuclease of toxin-antitoxin system